jgi:hypothetical protein
MIQLPLFATYRVFIVNRLHCMFLLNSHLQVWRIYKNAKTCYYNKNKDTISCEQGVVESFFVIYKRNRMHQPKIKKLMVEEDTYG